MNYDEVLAQKNKTMLQLLALKSNSLMDKSLLRALSDEVAFLEGYLAQHWLSQGRVDLAVRNIISEASCLIDTRRRAEAGRVLHTALSLEIPPLLRKYIEAEFGSVLSVAFHPNIPQAMPRILGNAKLRRPQLRSYEATLAHFSTSTEPAIVQLPVGCGKTGAMSLTPFGVAKTRVLLIAPSVVIRENLARRIDYSTPESFWRMANVFTNGTAPAIAQLNDGATVQDTDVADIVVANYQRLVGQSEWLLRFTPDYFDLIIIDEGHHNVTESYRTVFERFPKARRVSFTATPIRADGQPVEGKRIYRFPIADAIREGYIKDLASRRLDPTEITFTYKGEVRKHSLQEVMELREELWFSKGVALSQECNISIVDASIQCMQELRTQKDERQQIIAAACGVDHAKAIRSLYVERHLRAEVLFNEMEEQDKKNVLGQLERGVLDVIVQVMMLGEGADFPRLSVAAIFRPFRHIVPYIQFIGRIMRVIKQDAPADPANRGYVVSHVGLNVDRWWEELRKFDDDDQAFFEALAHGAQGFQGQNGQGEKAPLARTRFTPDMHVLNETIEYFVQERFLDIISRAQVDDLIHTMRLRGMDFEALGISKEEIEQRLTTASTRIKARGFITTAPVSRQEARKEARRRLDERVKSGAIQLLRALGSSVAGRFLVEAFPEFNARNDLVAAILLLNQEVQRFLRVESGERDVLTEEECKRAHDSMDAIIDAGVKRVKERRK